MELSNTMRAFKYIGGIYHYRDHVGDGRLPLQLGLVEHVFGPDAFRWSPELLNKLAPERWIGF